jgi:hypothetical protein
MTNITNLCCKRAFYTIRYPLVTRMLAAYGEATYQIYRVQLFNSALEVESLADSPELLGHVLSIASL